MAMVGRYLITAPADWQQMADLCPRLRSHIIVYPQQYRAQRWYVLHDSLSGRHTRINAAAHAFIGRLDGTRSIELIMQQISRLQPHSRTTHSRTTPALSQHEVTMLLLQLQQMGALVEGPERTADALVDEHAYQQRTRFKSRWSNPLAVRFPLFDPEPLLNRLAPYLLPWLGRTAMLLWVVVVGLALIAASVQWDELAQEFAGITSSSRYLVLLWFVYPLLKTVHEFAHAICLKRYGAEVHEMGITLLLLTPIPYVDASATWILRSRFQRVLVSAAGILAEVGMAALALLFWVSVEPGLARDVAFTVVMLGSMSTLLFNANPLLKFDGYYVLQDLIEIPNLYTRAQRYYVYLAKRYLLSVKEAVSPVSASGERAWFAVYGALAFAYRSIILLTIALWLIGKFLIIGVLLTLWAVTQQFILPLISAVHYIFNADELANRRSRSAGLIGAITLTLMLLLVLVPAPFSTRVEGVVWVPEQAQLYAGSAGQVAEVFVLPGAQVEPGDAVMRLEQPVLDARVRILEARLHEYKLREAAEQVSRSVQSVITAEDIAALTRELAESRRLQSQLLVTANASGTFTVGGGTRLLGRYFAQGDLIGHVIDPSQLVVRVVVPENRIGPVRGVVTHSSVRLAERFGEVIPATLILETPSANNRLPSAVLGTMGGGGIPIAAADQSRVATRDKVFHLEFSLPSAVQVSGVGERAYVNLQHLPEPLAKRWLDATRQLFLSRLSGTTV